MIGEVLPVEREDNQHNDYVVAVMKNGDIDSHMPHSISLHVNNPALIQDLAFISELRTSTPGF